jgi:hypothetical protein
MEPSQRLSGLSVERTFLQMLGKFYTLLPQILLILTLGLRIPQTRSNLQLDNITLHDILGRKYSLPTEYFRNWFVLIAMLNSRFHDCPGHVHVSWGFFTNMDVGDLGRRIGPTNWENMISKRKRSVMLINLSETSLVKVVVHDATSALASRENPLEFVVFAVSFANV